MRQLRYPKLMACLAGVLLHAPGTLERNLGKRYIAARTGVRVGLEHSGLIASWSVRRQVFFVASQVSFWNWQSDWSGLR